ncbi:MAG: acyltransferase family protein [Bacteroidales bacterium]
MKERFDFIDSLRGLAICSVFVNHSHSILKGNSGSFLDTLLSSGHYGVQLFFVISAFTIFLTYHKSKDVEKSPIRVFFVKRLFRIVPLYWFGIILYSLVYGLGSRGWLPGPELWHLPIHVFLMNDLHPLTQSSVVPGGWSISCEVLFYLSIPVLVYFVNSRVKALLLIVFSILLAPHLIGILKNYFDANFHAYPAILLNLYWYRSLLNQLPIFGFGILFYYIYITKMFRKGKLISAVFGVMSLAVILISLFYYRIPMSPHYFISFGFLLLAICLSMHSWQIVENKFFRFIGQISYSAYLIHALVINQVYKFLIDLELSNLHLLFALIFISFSITIPLSYLLYQFVEKPCINAGRTFNMYLNKKYSL